jgi:reverse gyrase
MILAKFKNIEEVKYENFFENLKEWKEHFKNLIGFNPWHLQEMSARRIFLNRSFTIIAPTSTIVAMMKERGIGRPSTYSTIIEKLLERNYVYEKNGFLIPTKLGILVYNFLNSLEEKEFFIKEEFTRELEKMMDNVEEGTENYQNVLLNIYENLFNIPK